MHILSVRHLTKTHGDRILFKDLTLHMNQGDKIGFIAPNGSGKSTILKMITGLEESDDTRASVFIHPDVRIGYLRQIETSREGETVMDHIFSSSSPQVQALYLHQKAIRQNDEALLTKAVQQMEKHHGWDIESRIEEILEKLNIVDPDALLKHLSGGQAKRVALAKLLIDDPDLLILDEPTNHLDIEMIHWLENYLSSASKSLLMVTHDRYFLEDVCNKIIELDQGELHEYPGNYAYFLQKREERAELRQTVQSKAEKLMRKELEWLNRMPRARTTKNKARIDAFSEIRETARKEIYRQDLEFNIAPQRLGAKILECHHIRKSFGEKKIVSDFSYKWKKGEKIGLVGKNGAGKSTFIRMLTGEEAPDSGKIVIGETVHFGYFTQDFMTLPQDQTVIDIIRDIADYLPLKKGGFLTAEQLLDRFLFPRPRQQIFYSLLSGGEKRRLQLLRILMSNPNFLILDEPTNDLDILTLNTLEAFLNDFEGCLLIASHDRYMTDKVADHLFIMDGKGNITDFNGSYSDYLDWQENQNQPEVKPISASPTETSTAREYELRKKIRRVENQIEKLEQKKTNIENKFQIPDLTVEDMKKWNRALSDVKEEISLREQEWEQWVDQLE